MESFSHEYMKCSVHVPAGLLAIVAPFAALVGSAAEYQGSVGKLEAVFSLAWKDDGSVEGTYHYPARPGATYSLVGSNPREGELHLEEYTGNTLTARCRLRKRIDGGLILWEGWMANTDGRRFPMAFSRKEGEAKIGTAFDETDARRDRILAAIRPEYHWREFPLSDEVVEAVPVDLPEGEWFGARVLSCRSEGSDLVMGFAVGDWDTEGRLLIDAGRQVVLHAARVLPLPSDGLVGREIAVVFDREGSLFSLSLAEIAVTHVRPSRGGKFEVRGLVDFFDPEESHAWSPEEFARRMLGAPVAEFLPDKLALDLEPGWAEGEIFFQSLRIVRDYGWVVQSTDAGPGSLELESLGLDAPADANPWILLEGHPVRLVAPPQQLTREAG